MTKKLELHRLLCKYIKKNKVVIIYHNLDNTAIIDELFVGIAHKKEFINYNNLKSINSKKSNIVLILKNINMIELKLINLSYSLLLLIDSNISVKYIEDDFKLTPLFSDLFKNFEIKLFVNQNKFPLQLVKSKIFKLYSNVIKIIIDKKKSVPNYHDSPKEDMIKRRYFYSNLLPNGGLVFDIGANYGNRIEPIIDLNYQIVAVEPQKECIQYLTKRYGNKLQIIPKGLSDKTEKLPIYRSNESVLTTFSSEWIQKVQQSGRFQDMNWNTNETDFIDMTTFDQLIEEFGIPNFAKIDVEGFEYKVLSGLTKPLPLISIEYTTPELQDNLENCIHYLNGLSSNYTFNYSIGETMKFELPVWENFSEFLKTISSEYFQNSRFGDVYAKLVHV